MSTKTGHQIIDSLADINGVIPPLFAWTFTATTGTATLTGYFLDVTGVQVGSMVTYPITSATTFTALYNSANSITSGTPLPSNLVGFEGALTGNALWYGKSGLINGTYGEAPKSGYPQIQTATLVLIGRVG